MPPPKKALSAATRKESHVNAIKLQTGEKAVKSKYEVIIITVAKSYDYELLQMVLHCVISLFDIFIYNLPFLKDQA